MICGCARATLRHRDTHTDGSIDCIQASCLTSSSPSFCFVSFLECSLVPSSCRLSFFADSTHLWSDLSICQPTNAFIHPSIHSFIHSPSFGNLCFVYSPKRIPSLLLRLRGSPHLSRLSMELPVSSMSFPVCSRTVSFCSVRT